ncbi:thioredoxin fold domain-containing protein [Moraxella canis]|uniref:Thioredoxin fold domain-containing protein n=1 Tax=Moraxella canis TaxID=90239 RepID=A0ABZ0WVB9_9GAMM|nr:thioredoxin fold domain-containing protein [Moraxella canis]WQE03174.1 thioredoxin fold domain-containing protein [Moraxella canis]
MKLIVCVLALVFSLPLSLSASANTLDTHDAIRSKLTHLGLTTPITAIEPSPALGFHQITLADGNHLLISDGLDYIIQGTPSPNPSPLTPIDHHIQKPLAMGTPISDAHRTALLNNLSAMNDMQDAAFYHTGIQGVLWGISGMGDTTFLITGDGRYLMDGAMASLKNGQFIEHSPVFEAAKNRHVFSTLNDTHLTIYPAKTAQKSVLYIASDINCPYCKVLHERIDELNIHGITVKIIGYPIYDESLKPMQQIWCEQNNAKRAVLLSAAMKGMTLSARSACQSSQSTLFATQKQALPLAIMGTPAVFDAQGRLFMGDLTNHEIYEFLSLE